MVRDHDFLAEGGDSAKPSQDSNGREINEDASGVEPSKTKGEWCAYCDSPITMSSKFYNISRMGDLEYIGRRINHLGPKKNAYCERVCKRHYDLNLKRDKVQRKTNSKRERLPSIDFIMPHAKKVRSDAPMVDEEMMSACEMPAQASNNHSGTWLLHSSQPSAEQHGPSAILAENGALMFNGQMIETDSGPSTLSVFSGHQPFGVVSGFQQQFIHSGSDVHMVSYGRGHEQHIGIISEEVQAFSTNTCLNTMPCVKGEQFKHYPTAAARKQVHTQKMGSLGNGQQQKGHFHKSTFVSYSDQDSHRHIDCPVGQAMANGASSLPEIHFQSRASLPAKEDSDIRVQTIIGTVHNHVDSLFSLYGISDVSQKIKENADRQLTPLATINYLCTSSVEEVAKIREEENQKRTVRAAARDLMMMMAKNCGMNVIGMNDSQLESMFVAWVRSQKEEMVGTKM